MYTEFHFNSKIKKDTPKEVINTLKYMLDLWEKGEPKEIPDHILFKNPESSWRVMLQMDSSYFDAETYSTLNYNKFDDHYYLCVRCNLKNYESDIENFINWITPYLDKYEGDFLGFYRYEEFEEPTLIYYTREEK